MKIAEKLQLGASTGERQLHRHLAKLYREQLNYPRHIVLGIDEKTTSIVAAPGDTSSP